MSGDGGEPRRSGDGVVRHPMKRTSDVEHSLYPSNILASGLGTGVYFSMEAYDRPVRLRIRSGVAFKLRAVRGGGATRLCPYQRRKPLLVRQDTDIIRRDDRRGVNRRAQEHFDTSSADQKAWPHLAERTSGVKVRTRRWR